MLSVQITGGLDLHPVGVAGIVSQRYILHFDDLHSLTHGAGLDRKLNGFVLGLFQRLLTGQLVVVHQLFIGAADLGDSGADGVGAAEVFRL